MLTTLAILQDVGSGEVLVIGVIALLLFGKNLPTVSRNIGRAIAEFKRSVSDASSEIRREMQAAAQAVDDTSSILDASQKPVIQNPTAILPLPATESAHANPIESNIAKGMGGVESPERNEFLTTSIKNNSLINIDSSEPQLIPEISASPSSNPLP